MKSNNFRKILRNIEKNVDKHGLYILIVLFILGPIIINFIFKKNIISNFTKPEMLDYYGVVISGVITFGVLKITIKNNNESLNKQIETQKEITMKQFEFELKQKQVKELEQKLENILDSCKISIEAIRTFGDIPKYLSESTIYKVLDPASRLFFLINDLYFIVGRVHNKFELALNSFIIDDIILCDEYKQFKLNVNQYINTYLDVVRNLSNTLNKIYDLITSIQDKSQKNSNNNLNYKNIVIDEKEKQLFANLKSNIDYYIGAHNAFEIRGWIELSNETAKFIKFLNKYIMNSSDKY